MDRSHIWSSLSIAVLVSVYSDNPLLGAGFGVVSLLACRLAFQGKHPKALVKPDKAISVTLIEKEQLSHDVRRFRFALPKPDQVLGLPVGKHIYVRAVVKGELVVRPYTPVTSDDDVGYFDLVVKVYFAGTHPRFPNGGKMSQYLESLSIGDTIDVRGPTGSITYNGRGHFDVESKKGKIKQKDKRHATKLGLIAGGTGITPILQLVRAILKDPADNTQIWLLFANQTENDILLRSELEECAKSSRFQLWYTLDRPPAEWKYSSGFVDKEMLATHLPAPGADTQILMCGPPVMVERALLPNLTELGFTSDNWMIS